MSKKFFLSACALAAFISGQAQQTDTSSNKQLDEVVVTANRFPQKQRTTGKVVTVITKEQIERSSGRTVPELINEQVGLTINGALSNLGSNQTVYMRGASSGRTLILVDGVPVSDPSYINNDFDLNLLSLHTIERIEIARGAQSTLYGSDAIAGVINIITTKKDVSKPVNIKAVVAAGNYGTIRANAQVYGKVGKLNYNASYGKLRSNGFSAAYDSTGNKNFDNDSYNGDVATASLSYQALPGLTLRSYIKHSKYKTDLDASLFTDETDYNNINMILLAGAGFHYQKDKWSINGNYQYSENSRNYKNDSLQVVGFTKFSRDEYKASTHFLELYSSVELNPYITLLHGADHRFNRMNSSLYSVSSFGPFTSVFNDTSISQSSLYASVFIHDAKERFNLEIGGRLNVHSRYGSNNTYTINPSFNISQHYRVFASLATGFKAPTLYQVYSAYGERSLKPERSTNYEFGVQQQHEKISSRIVYFYRKIEDGIDFNNQTFKYFNFIKQTVSGVELEATVKPVTALTLSANYSYIKPEEYSQSRVTFRDSIYSYLLRRPQHNLNVTAGLQATPALFVSVTGKYVGERYDAGGYKAKDLLLDSYFILNAYAEYKYKEHWKVFATASNITNKKFFDVRGYNSIPFLINGGISFSW